MLEPVHAFMHAMWLAAPDASFVEFEEEWAQSVHAPIGRLNIKPAFCFVEAVFSTASVKTTAGYALALRSVGFIVL